MHQDLEDAHWRLPETEISRVGMRRLLMRFESLGGRMEGCEFGLLQRAYDAEPLGLLRWADVFPEELALALEHQFDGVGEPGQTVLHPPHADGADWTSEDRRFGMRMHTFHYAPNTPANTDTLFSATCRRLRFLRRKLIDDLLEGEKTFVYKLTYEALDEARLDRIYRGIRNYGPSTLLYVREPDDDHAAATVAWVRPGLLIGYIERFSHAFGHGGAYIGAATECWTPIVRAASQLLPSPGPSIIRHRGQDKLIKNDGELLENLAADAEREQKWLLVIAISEYAISLGHETPGLYSRLFDAYLFLDRHEKAEAVLNRGLSLFADTDSLVLKKARFHTVTRDYPAAAAAWSTLQEKFPTAEEPCAMGAFCLSQADDVPGALLTLRRGLERMPNSIQIWLLYMEQLMATGQPDDAYATWESTSREFMSDHRALLLGARIEYKRNNLDHARLLLLSSMDASGGTPDQAQLELRRELFRDQDPRDAASA